MLTPDEKVAITFNGEIYNFREVRTELLVKGHAFRTESDTEVILAAWREWGPDCLSRLQGMFVFALYDAAADTLFLARDRLGRSGERRVGKECVSPCRDRGSRGI